MFDDQRRSFRQLLGKRCAPVLTIAAIAIAAPLTAQEVTVQRGETLGGIAAENGVPLSRIVAYNGIHNPNLIYEGQVLRIPPAEGEVEHVLVPGDTLARLARRYGTTVDALVARNSLTNPDKIVAGRTLIVPPAGAPSPGPAPTAAPATTEAPATTAAPVATAPPTTAAPATTTAPATTAPATTAAPTTTAAPATIPPVTVTAPPTTAPPATTGAPAPGVVVSTIWLIQEGDTVTSIAAKVGVTPARLAEANGLGVNTPLIAGQYLFVPQR